MKTDNTQNPTKHWFQDHFTKLHPLLQKLHTKGGTLQGNINIEYANGIAGAIGHALAKKLNISEQGQHDFTVTITHTPESMSWNRCFNNNTHMNSTFKPIGTINNGYWVEQTGWVQIKLTVDIKEGGWYWRTLGFRIFGLPFPKWLFPKVKAYKSIENNQYLFYVGFSLPILGKLFSYSGKLEAQT